MQNERMSIWNRVCLLEGEPLQQVKALYDPVYFPIEFRHYFSEMIENEDWSQINPDNQTHAPKAKEILHRWLQEVQNYAQTNIDFVLRLKLMDIASQLNLEYYSRPLELVRKTKLILETEIRVVQEGQIDVVSVTDEDPGYRDEENIRESLNQLYVLTRVSEDELRTLQSKQENFFIRYQQQIRVTDDVEKTAKQGNITLKNQLLQDQERFDKELTHLAAEILGLRQDFKERQQRTLMLLQEIQEKILNHKLVEWKKQQRLQFNGYQACTGQLKKIQEWCEKLAEIVWSYRQQILRSMDFEKLLPINSTSTQTDVSPHLSQLITTLLHNLVCSSFIIEVQPPQVVKTQTRFGAQVRLLIGNKLSMHLNPPSVRAVILSESQAQDIMDNQEYRNGSRSVTCFDQGTGDILNSTSVMEYNPSSGGLAANFRNMSLRRIKRSDRRGADTVTEEKFSILFHATFHVGTTELVFVARTLSLPIVVIVHGNQEANASASILWDNAFAQPGRELFQVPDKIQWKELIEMLSSKWKYELNCKFGLSVRAIAYLGQKCFRGQAFTDKSHVSWSIFNRENMPGRCFTFWQWFDSVMTLMKSKLCISHWNDRAIVGFIDRRECEQILMNRPSGTFLMRFSDSELGALSYANNSNGSIQHLKPQTQKDFSVKRLYSQLQDLGSFIYCYTENDAVLKKNVLFERYFLEEEKNNKVTSNDRDYISMVLKVTVAETKTDPDPKLKAETSNCHSFSHSTDSIMESETPKIVYDAVQ